MTTSLIAAMGMVAGCASPPPAPVVAPVDPVTERLQVAMSKVAALPEFTRSADNKAPEPKLGALVTASFRGDAGQILKLLADARGKEFKVRGPKPHLPLPVHVDAVNQPYEEFLKDVGYQFGQRADLVLSSDSIEIRYRGQP